MSRKKDLTGMRFGKLTAVESTSERKNGYTIWICKCDCGNIVRVPSRFLKNSWSSSCGCEGKKEAFEDLTGKRFGKLKVISRREERDDHRRILWNCVCDCGNTIIAPSGQLRNGYRRSCGCLSRPPLKDWVGKQFGALTVIAYDGKRDKSTIGNACAIAEKRSLSASQVFRVGIPPAAAAEMCLITQNTS